VRPYRVTLRDVAQRAGVSQATASFVTTGRDDMRISEQARQRVLRAAVVSFDDSDLASWLRPQLTSVALPHAGLGRRAVELLLVQRDFAGVERVPMPLRTRSSIGRRE